MYCLSRCWLLLVTQTLVGTTPQSQVYVGPTPAGVGCSKARFRFRRLEYSLIGDNINSHTLLVSVHMLYMKEKINLVKQSTLPMRAGVYSISITALITILLFLISLDENSVSYPVTHQLMLQTDFKCLIFQTNFPLFHNKQQVYIYSFRRKFL